MSLDPGRLRHRIELQSQMQTRDDDGAVAVEWRSEGFVWAAIEPLSAREFIAGQALSSEVDTRITIRYRPDVRADWRAVYRGKTYAIRGVLPDKSSGLEYLTLPAVAGATNGG